MNSQVSARRSVGGRRSQRVNERTSDCKEPKNKTRRMTLNKEEGETKKKKKIGMEDADRREIQTLNDENLC